MDLDRLRERVQRVRTQIAEAAQRVGRNPSDITLIAVTKGHPSQVARAALDVGLTDLGENRVEELVRKVPELEGEAGPGRAARWHLIGTLQRRKVPEALPLVSWIHSVDSMRLAERIARVASRDEGAKPVRVLIQVNVSGEASKSGFAPQEVLERLPSLVALTGLSVRGLMTMAPFTEDEDRIRNTFRGLRSVQEAAGEIPGYRGEHLSMGMSNDFEIAVEEGSTMVRVGTALFGERSR